MTLLEQCSPVAIFMGARRDLVDDIPVGNIAAIGGLKNIKSGETLIEPKYLDEMTAFENVKYVTTPVITVSVEPEYLKDFDTLKRIIQDMLIEDPNLQFNESPETGELLISGMGPLHLEVTVHEIKQRGIDVSTSKPQSVFKESCVLKSSLIASTSPNEKNSVKLRIERIDQETLQFFRSGDHKIIKPFKRLKQYLNDRTNLNAEEIDGYLNCDSNLNLIIDLATDSPLAEKQKAKIIDVIEKICLSGPLCNEVLTEIKITIESINISANDEESSISELTTMFFDAIKRGLDEAELVLLEPIYQTIIQLPPEMIKNALSVLAKYQLKVKEIVQDNEYQALIELLMPVRYSMEFVESIRDKTSGRAFWQNTFHSFQKVPSDVMDSIVSDIRFKKGLSW